MRVATRLAAELVASDRRYFELGARVESVAGARFAWMPGLADVSAGCVVLGAEVWRDGDEAAPALDALTARVAEVGGRRVRLYAERLPTAIVRVLEARGFVSRREEGLIVADMPGGAKAVSLQPVVDESDWLIKAALHRESPDAPDGHDTTPERWVEMERRKAARDGFVPWLVRVGGTVAGTAGTIEQGALLRLKNLVVHRDLRRRGVATAAIAAFGEMAAERGRALGFFSVPGTPGAALYRGCGTTPVLEWVEWLGPPIGEARPAGRRT